MLHHRVAGLSKIGEDGHWIWAASVMHNCLLTHKLWPEYRGTICCCIQVNCYFRVLLTCKGSKGSGLLQPLRFQILYHIVFKVRDLISTKL